MLVSHGKLVRHGKLLAASSTAAFGGWTAFCGSGMAQLIAIGSVEGQGSLGLGAEDYRECE